ncbi:MAG TPA: M4 family metallopeptidase [Mycobacteriales bacterium]|jgi:Zn-dependent metalloprotease|nr:M4 family metallopeptidase [Mycobacteriales bacterium]
MTPCRCAILPPYLLRAVLARGSQQQRQRARRTLVDDEVFRRLRGVVLERAAVGDDGSGPLRTVSDAGHTEQLPGRPVREEGAPPTGDLAVDEAYDGFGLTWQLYREVYGRDSVDAAGLPLLGTVHFSTDYDNAFWDGTRMVFGDGDGELFGRFTASVDVIGHELTHGVTEIEAALVYAGQSGALNESVSDVFGSLVKQRARGQSAEEADWLIGAELLRPGVDGVALRSMRAPGTAYDDPVLGTDPQPASMDHFVVTDDDQGGVHLNSGIPNHAFYLASVAAGGYAWETTGRVWYDALRDEALAPDADFAAFAAVTVRVAPDDLRAAVHDAWQQVGVTLEA